MYKLIKIKEGYIITSEDKIEEKDFIIERGKPIVKCKTILDSEDLVWESLNTKSSACDGIFNFKKIIASTFIKELPTIDFNGFEDEVVYIESKGKEYIQSLQTKECEIEVELKHCETYRLDECNSRFSCCNQPLLIKITNIL